MKLNEVFEQPTEEVPTARKVKAAQKLSMSKKFGGRKWELKFKELNPENALNRITHAHSRGKPINDKDLQIIANDAEHAAWYATHVVRDRWPPGEPAIVKVPKHATGYARWLMKKRWPEAEPYIAQDPVYAPGYAIQFFPERWTEAEPAIMTHPPGAATYAMHYGFRLPPAIENEVFKSWRRESYKKKFNIP